MVPAHIRIWVTKIKSHEDCGVSFFTLIRRTLKRFDLGHMCHVLSFGPELLQVRQGGYRVACCGFREHLSQEAIGGSRVVACSQLEPLGQQPMKVPFISTSRFMIQSRLKQHLGKTMHHMRRNIFTAGEKVNKKQFYLPCKILWPGPPQPRLKPSMSTPQM